MIEGELMDHPTPKCPACGTPQSVAGRVSDARPATFLPNGLRFWTLTVPMVPLLDRPGDAPRRRRVTAHACTGCGLVWAYVDPERLRTVIRNAAKKTGTKR